MKAYGMANRLRNSMGVRTDVQADEDDESYLRIQSELTPNQLNQVQTLAGANGWTLATKGKPEASLVLVEEVKVGV